ncbi:hypothetical protein FGO68_gene8569 [Halteria grandinella]|uniref:Uncharacterized protein n=1 Tax=Halteria grandinella TaxID=5974 RepID=A0A8J8T138_HALGN|nr:hypothetical protein FGO68_gene8569 [Halteria grandinella]
MQHLQSPTKPSLELTPQERKALRKQRFQGTNTDNASMEQLKLLRELEYEKKKARALKFGIETKDIKKEKKRERAQRFGINNEWEKKRQRRERFGQQQEGSRRVVTMVAQS